MIDKKQVIDYINKEFSVSQIKNINEGKKTINVRFVSQGGLYYSVTLNKDKFKEV